VSCFCLSWPQMILLSLPPGLLGCRLVSHTQLVFEVGSCKLLSKLVLSHNQEDISIIREYPMLHKYNLAGSWMCDWEWRQQWAEQTLATQTCNFTTVWDWTLSLCFIISEMETGRIILFCLAEISRDWNGSHKWINMWAGFSQFINTLGVQGKRHLAVECPTSKGGRQRENNLPWFRYFEHLTWVWQTIRCFYLLPYAVTQTILVIELEWIIKDKISTNRGSTAVFIMSEVRFRPGELLLFCSLLLLVCAWRKEGQPCVSCPSLWAHQQWRLGAMR
jgi:hypothetical protein